MSRYEANDDSKGILTTMAISCRSFSFQICYFSLSIVFFLSFGKSFVILLLVIAERDVHP